MPRQREVPAPLHKGGWGRLLSENRETDLVVMSEMEHLPSKDSAKWHRRPEPECQFSLSPERRDMGRERETQWEEPHLKDTSKRRNREEHAALVSPGRKTSVFHVCLMFHS